MTKEVANMVSKIHMVVISDCEMRRGTMHRAQGSRKVVKVVETVQIV